jgi:hypothetical protein
MRYYQRLTLEFKTGTFVMPLIEEKIGNGFAGVFYPNQRCARCANVAPVAKNSCEKCFTPRRNESATFPTPLYNRAGRYRE